MRVVVTGAGGFVGAHAAAAFAGHEVHGVDVPAGSRARWEALAPEGAQFHEVDLLREGDVDALLCAIRPELLVHLAWYAVPGKYLDALENLDHLTASTRLLLAFARAGGQRVVTAGTCFEYDTEMGRLSESSPTRPRFLYAATKLALGEVARETCRRLSMTHAHARIFYPYGPWEAPGRLVPVVATALLAGQSAKVTRGEQLRDYIHVADVGRAFATIALNGAEGAVNVASGVPVVVRELVLAIARALGREDLVQLGALPDRPGDPREVTADVARLAELGFQPRFDVEAGVADTLAWYRSSGGFSR